MKELNYIIERYQRSEKEVKEIEKEKEVKEVEEVKEEEEEKEKENEEEILVIDLPPYILNIGKKEKSEIKTHSQRIVN
jgi:hypothetical protein